MHNDEGNFILKNGQKVRLYLHKKVRLSIFLTFFMKIISSNIYWGIASAASKEINQQYTNNYYGLGGPGIGQALGAILLMSIINSANRKWIINTIIIIETISIFTLSQSKEPIVALICEGIIGACDMITIILAPIWIDQFGIQRFKTLSFILIELAIPLGRCIGFILINGLSSYHWTNCLYAEVVLLIIAILLFVSYPDLYFSSKIQIEAQDDGKSEKMEKKETREVSVFQIRRAEFEAMPHESTCSQIISLLKNPIFVCGVLSKIFIVFIQTILLYRLSSYMADIVKIESDSLRVVYYLVIILVGPIGGVLLGVLITSSKFSYNEKYSGVCLVILYGLTCAFAQGMIYYSNKDIMFFLFAIGLFMFCSSAMPMIQGILISSIPNHIKGLGYTLSHILTLFLGVGPSLYVYDFLHKKLTPMMGIGLGLGQGQVEGQEQGQPVINQPQHTAMEYLCNVLFIGLFFAFLVMIFKLCERKVPIQENGMTKKATVDFDTKSEKSSMSKIAEGISHAYTGCAPNLQDNDNQLDKSIEKEVNLDDMEDHFSSHEKDNSDTFTSFHNK